MPRTRDRFGQYRLLRLYVHSSLVPFTNTSRQRRAVVDSRTITLSELDINLTQNANRERYRDWGFLYSMSYTRWAPSYVPPYPRHLVPCAFHNKRCIPGHALDNLSCVPGDV